MMLMMRWEPVCSHGSMWQSNTEYWRTFCLGSAFIVFPSYQQVEWGGGGGQEMDSQHDINDQAGFPDPSHTHIQWTGFTIILWLERWLKPFFVFSSSTIVMWNGLHCRQNSWTIQCEMVSTVCIKQRSVNCTMRTAVKNSEHCKVNCKY